MKCALVIPSWLPEEIFSSKTAGSQINYWQPLGTLYVAASLQKAGHTVNFLNGAFMSHDAIIRDLHTFKPDVVGIYSTAFGWKKTRDTASDIKRRFGSIYIIVGGPYPIAVREECLQGTPDIDAVVSGEGEFTVVEMLERLSKGESLRDVQGVIFREGSSIITNPSRPLIGDLDALPFPARDLLGDEMNYIPPPATYKRKPVAVITTSRGCNRRCLFCFQIDKTRESGIRFRSVDNVMQEIELCLAKGYREIKFIDDTLAADYDRAMRLVQEIKARKLDVTWFASACVNQVDLALLKAFKEAGCWAILLGAESGVQKNLNAIRKGTTVRQIRDAVSMGKEAGLIVYTPFLFGIPGQTFEDGLRTIEFACELDPDIANFHAITPFPGSELYDNLHKYGTMSDDLSDFTYQGAAFVPYSMTREEIMTLRQMAFRKFYSRPTYILKRLLSLRSANDVRVSLKGLKSLFWLWMQKDIFNRKGHYNQ